MNKSIEITFITVEEYNNILDFLIPFFNGEKEEYEKYKINGWVVISTDKSFQIKNDTYTDANVALIENLLLSEIEDMKLSYKSIKNI